MTSKPVHSMMHKTFKRLWIKALRSGKYKQTRNVLYRGRSNGVLPVGHCCLGVLYCVVYKKNPRRNVGGLSNLLKKKVNLDDSTEGLLINLNDVKKWSFAQIAEWVEKKL